MQVFLPMWTDHPFQAPYGEASSQWPERSLAEKLLVGCTSLWWNIGFQIAEQASQGLLVVVVLLPAGEVGNVPHAFKMCCPAYCALHDGVVKANGKEHQSVFLILFGKGGLDLEFYPRASDGMLGEHQQQFIVQVNGLVDALPDFVTGLHVFRSKPAAHAFALQIGIEPVGKVLVAAGIANKAGVILDGMVHKGTHIGEEVLWHTSFAQKYFGNIPLRAIDGINTNVRWACMFYCLQSPHGAQIDIVELYRSDSSIAEVGSTEVGTAEVDTVENGIAKVGIAEVGIAEVSIAQVSIAQIGSTEVNSSKEGPSEVSSAEMSTTKVGSVEVGIAEVGTNEVGIAEVRLCCWMLLSPRIPGVWPLLQHFQLVLICHVDYLLCSAFIIEKCGHDCKHVSFCFSRGDGSSPALFCKISLLFGARYR